MTAVILSFADALKARGRKEGHTPQAKLLQLNHRIAVFEGRATAQANTHRAMLLAGVDPAPLERALWETMDALTLLRHEQWALCKPA